METRRGCSVGPWVEQVPTKVLHARMVVNSTSPPRAPWVPPSYLPRVPLAEKWAAERRERQRQEQERPARKPWEPPPLADMLAELQRTEREVAQQEEAMKRPLQRQPVFGATPLLTDPLRDDAAWLRAHVPQDLLQQRERFYRRKGWPLDPTHTGLEERLARLEEVVESDSLSDLLQHR
eukprot:TRINITY_DN8692_c0_g11_i1.p1 TRINITY_DN8692_c0_g11~~TRINITY_DN8692_c0_g11_i1.p1  ORF type:complete len:205 (+),score=66.37 TRINITY_DN8692_c0_g11_i1:81-617(+)